MGQLASYKQIYYPSGCKFWDDIVAHKNKVMRSINLDSEHICVDIFCRPDGTYGFDEFRRDPEDTNGWYSIGHFGDQVFADQDTALSEAKKAVHWLAGQL